MRRSKHSSITSNSRVGLRPSKGAGGGVARLTAFAVTERARKLRANYNIHAQSLRTRIEIRVNRIPLALRKLTMGELLQKYSAEQQQKPAEVKGAARGPPVPAKDTAPSRAPARRALATTAPPLARPPKRPRFAALHSTAEPPALTAPTATRSRAETRRTKLNTLKPPRRGLAATRQPIFRATPARFCRRPLPTSA